MSQQRPPNPTVTILMWGVLFITGYFLFFGNKGPADTRSADEIYQKIVQLNKAADYQGIQTEVRNYDNKLKEDVANGKVSPKERDEKEFSVTLMQAQTLYVAGHKTDNHGLIEQSYNTIKGEYERYHNSDLWTHVVEVEPYKDTLPQKEITAQQFYTFIVAELGKYNKTATLLGYIPGYGMMDWLVKLTGSVPGFSYWFAAFLLALIVRLAVLPLAQKQYKWGRKMSQLAPYIKEIKEKFTDKKTGKVSDQQAMSAETMELYKRYGMNPFSGCLPAIIQMPLFLIIYRCMLLYRFEFTKGYFLWIKPGATSFLGLHLAPNLGERDYLLIVLYGISMIATSMLTPVSDPANAKQQRLMGIGVGVFFAISMFFYSLPSAFIAYWIFTNILATAQSLYVYRLPLEPLVPVQTAAGGVIPTSGTPKNGKATNVDPGFFGKTGKGKSKSKKKKKPKH
ncbi:MAG TPA: YidC/Oxa1 family membrane protein insertase [Fimbriimonadaceae bacterium]|nr:YidC/Oxa1 family membrane protein insertase [Fimbriimonadaceae bacterium]